MSEPQQVTIARSWIGTPYRHQGARRGVGCDCLGLIRGVWQEIYGAEPEAPGPYGMDWAERWGDERLIDAAARHCGARIDRSAMQPGDLILFRWRAGYAAKHAGILSGERRFIHAYEQAGVIESALVPSWERRIAAVFRFPRSHRCPRGRLSGVQEQLSCDREGIDAKKTMG